MDRMKDSGSFDMGSSPVGITKQKGVVFYHSFLYNNILYFSLGTINNTQHVPISPNISKSIRGSSLSKKTKAEKAIIPHIQTIEHALVDQETPRFSWKR